MNELLYQVLLFSAQIFTSARSTRSHDRPNIPTRTCFYTSAFRSMTVGTWFPWADVLNIVHFIFLPGILFYVGLWCLVTLFRRVLMCS